MDRAQPGAIDSLVRNYELGDALGQFSDGWVVPASEPTASAQRSDLDETAFTAFDESSSNSSLTVTIGPGEAFVNGWLATDTSTDVNLAASTAGQTVGVSWDPDAVYDPDTDTDRDAADRVIVALEGDVSGVDPFLPLWTFDTDESGVTSVVDERPVGAALGPASIEDEAGNIITDLVGENLRLVNGELRGTVGIDTRQAVNDLFIQNAEQDFALGLNMLEYQDGQYEVFANDERIRSISDTIDLQLGSPLNDLGYAAIGFKPDLSAGIGIEYGKFTGHTASVNTVTVTSSYGYSGSDDGSVKQWDPDTMDGTGNEFTGHSGPVDSVFVTSSYGYSGSSDDTVKQWDPGTMNGTGDEFTGHSGTPNSIVVTNSYGYSAGGFGDEIVRQWDPETMDGTGAVFSGHTDVVLGMDLNASYGYSAGRDGPVKQWDPDTMDGTGNEFTGHTDGEFVNTVAVTSSYGYSGSDDQTVKQWDPDTMNGTGEEFTGHSDSVTSVFVTSSYGYSVSRDGTVRRWGLETMNGTGDEFTGHTNDVFSVFVGGSYGYSGGEDNTVRQWAGEEPATEASVAHTFQNLGFVPTAAVINDDLRQPLPANADVYYQIEDADGNTQTIPRSEIDSTVELTGFTSSSVSTTAIIERDDSTVESPQLDAWALYLTDQ